MTIRHSAIAYLITAATFFALDAIWLYAIVHMPTSASQRPRRAPSNNTLPIWLGRIARN
ncbi:hypothetical protein [Variovorax gracilis]|uniref:hypothetical protein n=1 Tax=Variovorax gracilis TaxID=3053502 RepID=UPI002578DD39|nr:hypothetical protein [Variovorax sp. J22R24]